jgi:hypothetical protein
MHEVKIYRVHYNSAHRKKVGNNPLIEEHVRKEHIKGHNGANKNKNFKFIKHYEWIVCAISRD